MNTIFVVSQLRDWPFDLPGVNVVSAKKYLMDPAYGDSHATRVVNLCRSCRYQSRGYYVSLLAEARGHAPLPGIKTIEDMHSPDLLRLLSEALEPTAQTLLQKQRGNTAALAVHFGEVAEPGFAALGEALFALLPAPLLQVEFQRRDGHWTLATVQQRAAGDALETDRAQLEQAARRYLQRGHATASTEAQPAADAPLSLAILVDPHNSDRPSNDAALQKFVDAGAALGVRAEILDSEQIAPLTRFDALFLRDTTSINHVTYQLARQAAAAGMIVIDDADSILKCNNKVYLTELLTRHHLPVPKTLLVQRDNIDQIVPSLGLPCILKQPDGAFSHGIVKVEDEDLLEDSVARLLDKSDIILAQEFLPTDYDWRIGVLDRRPLFACKYFMAPGHWQIIDHQNDGEAAEGRTQALAIGEVPDLVLQTALEAANLIGDGFYGVDVKEIGSHCYVIEVNDNPNVDAGNEDGILQDALYREIVAVFRKRVLAARRARAQSAAMPPVASADVPPAAMGASPAATPRLHVLPRPARKR